MWNVGLLLRSKLSDRSIFNHEKHERHEIITTQVLPQRHKDTEKELQGLKRT